MLPSAMINPGGQAYRPTVSIQIAMSSHSVVGAESSVLIRRRGRSWVNTVGFQDQLLSYPSFQSPRRPLGESAGL